MSKKDILGPITRTLVTVPQGRLGLVRDLVNKFADPTNGEEWDQQGQLFLRKEPCFTRDPSEIVEEVMGKFTLLADLGVITVPADYDHATRLAKFREKHQGGEKKSFRHYADNITDANFPNPTRILQPGDKLRVRAFRQIAGGTTTSSEERMAFLTTQKAVYVGTQGLSLVFDQKRDQLPKGKWYASFDKKDRLWKDADGSHRVPSVFAQPDGDFVFNLGYFVGVWYVVSAFLCLSDLEPKSGT